MPTTPRQKLNTALWCTGMAAVLLAVCSKSSPLYVLNDWMDANIFFTMGKSMANGLVLYRDVFDHKGPVLYLLYALVHPTGFTGVWLLEIAALAVTLAAGLATAGVLVGKRLHPAWCAVPGVAVCAVRAFSHGGSAEEFCLPFLALALLALVRVLAAGGKLPLPAVVAQGVLAGCALWLKYTVLGFYLAWVLVLAVAYLRRGWGRALLQSAGAYLGGMALATLPWVVYFGLNHALGDWFTAYFYDNLFLYSGTAAPALPQKLWWAVRDNLPAAALLAAALVRLACTRKKGVTAAVIALAAGLAATSLLGGYLVYYGLPLAVFAALGLAPLAALAARLPAAVPRWRGALAALAPVAALGLALVLNPNTRLLGRTAADLPQTRFAAVIAQTAQTQSPTLLNYGTLDGGFYTAAGILPPCRYFCVTNMPLEEQWQQQWAILEQGAVDYVVSLVPGLEQQYSAYQPLDAVTYDGGEGECTWYLYGRR